MSTHPTHWGVDLNGARELHDGERELCAADNCPKGTATTPEGRLRLATELFEEQDTYAIAAEFLYDRRFESDEWPRTGYPVPTSDLRSFLDALDKMRERVDYNADRFNRQIRENSKNQEYLLAMNKDLQEKDREIQGLKAELERKEELILSLRMHGGSHHFAYNYQRDHGDPDGPQNWVNYCKVCDKPSDDPSHIGNGVKALSSKDVEAAIEAAFNRLLALLFGMHIGAVPAKEMAREILAGLPGLPE